MKTKPTRKKPRNHSKTRAPLGLKPERLTLLAIHSMLDEGDWQSVQGLALHLFRLAQRRQQ